jgi:hypothetical protein
VLEKADREAAGQAAAFLFGRKLWLAVDGVLEKWRSQIRSRVA